MKLLVAGVFLSFLLPLSGTVAGGVDVDPLRLPSKAAKFFHSDDGTNGEDSTGTRWAVLIAGSKGYHNYRHQADICHMYQILRKGGVKDENIIVFMYDDIAFNESNPHPGILINRPGGEDVYKGVPKDYTGEDINNINFLAAIRGDKSATVGGSGKVLDTSPEDHIFIYYTDHGAPGKIGMPSKPYLYADDLVDALKDKAATGTYKSMVFYVEACNAGSMFEGLLPEGTNIYAMAASNSTEGSWITYCPGTPDFPPEFDVCLGDLWSITFLEDCDAHNLRTETVHQQFELVKNKIAYASTVSQYGDIPISNYTLSVYMGTDPANDNRTFVDENSLRPPLNVIHQRDADLYHLLYKYQNTPEGSSKKVEAQKQLLELMSHRVHVDNSITSIGKLLFGMDDPSKMLNAVRPTGQPLVDDWKCLKAMIRSFETHCGSLSEYGMKHTLSFANMCNAGIRDEQLAQAAAQVCVTFPSNSYSSLAEGFSA